MPSPGILGTWLITCVGAIGLSLFAIGFFLTRVELRLASSCEADPFAHFSDLASTPGGSVDAPAGASSARVPSGASSSSSGCWLEAAGWDEAGPSLQPPALAAPPRRAPFSRLIFLVIDAWRFDFAEPLPLLSAAGGGSVDSFGARPAATESEQPVAQPHYRGKMPRLASLLRACDPSASASASAAPCSARLMRFVADAPTVTAQRLKGLLSGSLPTFVDVSANFAAARLGEDNWLGQLAARDAAWDALDRRRRGGAAGGKGAKGGGRLDTSPAPARERIFLGDDTWMNMFPSEANDDGAPGDSSNGGSFNGSSGGSAPPPFSTLFPFSSFNVRDLHTVDRGVLGLLFPALRGRIGAAAGAQPSASERASGGGGRADAPPPPHDDANADAPPPPWSLIVGHMLGVDHVGHRFNSPDVPEMAAKLEEMDVALEAVVAELLQAPPAQGGAGGGASSHRGERAPASWREDTLLVVIGDHGMTGSGAHGGASAEETDAALLVFAARRGLFRDGAKEEEEGGSASSTDPQPQPPLLRHPTQRQVDLVPSLALLLGMPIPFASLGTVFSDLSFAPPRALAGEGGRGAPSTGSLAQLLGALHDAHAAALNAAQVWRYLHTYNGNAKRLPGDDIRQCALQHAEAGAAYAAALADATGVAFGAIAMAAPAGAGVEGLCKRIATDDHSSDSSSSSSSSSGRSEALVEAAVDAAFHCGSPLDSATSSHESKRSGDSSSTASRLRSRHRFAATYEENNVEEAGSSAAHSCALLNASLASLESASKAQLWTASPSLVRAQRSYRCAVHAARVAYLFGDFAAPTSEADALSLSRRLLSAAKGLRKTISLSTSFTSFAFEVCRRLWSQFDETSMVTGLVLMVIAMLLLLYHAFEGSSYAGGVVQPLYVSIRVVLVASSCALICAALWQPGASLRSVVSTTSAVIDGAASLMRDAVLPALASPSLAGSSSSIATPPDLSRGVGSPEGGIAVVIASAVRILGATSDVLHDVDARLTEALSTASTPATLTSSRLLLGGLGSLLYPRYIAPLFNDEASPPGVEEAVPIPVVPMSLFFAAAAGLLYLQQCSCRTRAVIRTISSTGRRVPKETAQQPLSTSLPISAISFALLIVVILRVWCFATNSMIVEEAACVGYLLQSTIVLAGAASVRALLLHEHLRRGRSVVPSTAQVTAEKAARESAVPQPTPFPKAATFAVVCSALFWLLAVRAIQQRTGWLWPFPPSSVRSASVETSASALPSNAVTETGTGQSSIGWRTEAAADWFSFDGPSIGIFSFPSIRLLAFAAAVLLTPLAHWLCIGVLFPAAMRAVRSVAFAESVSAKRADAKGGKHVEPSPFVHPQQGCGALLHALLVLVWMAQYAAIATFWVAQGNGWTESSALYRIVLPRAIFASVVGTALGLCIFFCTWRGQSTSVSPLKGVAGSSSSAAVASSDASASDVAHLRLLLMCSLLPAMLLSLGPGGLSAVLFLPGIACAAAVLATPVFLSPQLTGRCKAAVEEAGAIDDADGGGGSLEGAANAVAAGSGGRYDESTNVVLGVILGILREESNPVMAASAWSAVHWYFSTGHGNQFNTLHFASPFIGFDDFHIILSSLLVLFNTLGFTFLLAGVAPPHRLVPYGAAVGDDRSGGVVLRARRLAQETAALKTVIPTGLSLLGIAIFNHVARRHLMVWSIFAPKFVFEVLLSVAHIGSFYFS